MLIIYYTVKEIWIKISVIIFGNSNLPEMKEKYALSVFKFVA